MTETSTDALPGPGGVEGTEIGRLFTRIIGDPEFKRRLLDDPDAALEGYDLSQAQVLMVKTLEEEDFDKLSMENLGEYFSADAAVYTPDEAAVADQDAYSAEDFLDLAEEPEVREEHR
jgi:hypothetical protein